MSSSEVAEADLRLLRECTGLKKAPTKPAKEAYVICGRRSGKSTISSLLAVFYAIWGDWAQYLSVGERAKVFVIATNMDQAKIIMGKIKGLLGLNAFLRSQVAKTLAWSVELKNSVDIEVKPASWRTVRGFSSRCRLPCCPRIREPTGKALKAMFSEIRTRTRKSGP